MQPAVVQRRAQLLRHLHQNPVAGRLPETVVDQAEPVQIDQQQRQGPGCLAGDGRSQSFQDQRARAGSGQRVDVGPRQQRQRSAHPRSGAILDSLHLSAREQPFVTSLMIANPVFAAILL